MGFVGHWGEHPPAIDLLPRVTRLEKGQYRECEAFVGMVYSPELREQLLQRKIPTISTDGDLSEAKVPRVRNDDLEVGRLAARTFLGRGHQCLAFAGWKNSLASNERERGFAQEAEKVGIEIKSLELWGNSNRRRDWVPRLKRFAKSLPKPAAIFFYNDVAALESQRVLTKVGHVVPDEISILGCGDDHFQCHAVHPNIASVITNDREVGRRAGMELEALLEGRSAQREVLVPPVGIRERGSLGWAAVADADMKSILEIFQERAHHGDSISEMAKAIGMDRRTLERRVRQNMNESPLEVIHRIRLNRALTLLRTTENSLVQIALDSGYSSQSSFGSAFRRRFGATPGAYRKKHSSLS